MFISWMTWFDQDLKADDVEAHEAESEATEQTWQEDEARGGEYVEANGRHGWSHLGNDEFRRRKNEMKSK